ncbi:MAG: Cation diffusion facilitator family transporter, partial [Haloplasmataceae bacterium]|nr:Cation diffusion facilitator family transporter [Haloplasmataceae bacterium]
MVKVMIRAFIKNYQNIEDKHVREGYSVLAGILGIICNIFLFCLKLTIGYFMNSIAIISDAFNNLSDTGSSLISIIGAKLSNRSPDKEHPFGHGRFEYISSLIVSFIIILVGFELLKTSINKVIHPEEIVFSPILLIILILSIFVKIWMFSYNRYVSKIIDSSVIRATAYDSLNDVIATSAVILSTVIGYYLNISIDGIIGIIVSLLIIYTGYEIAKEVV